MTVTIEIEPDGEAVHERCADCEEVTRSVWGYVSSEQTARAVYFIRWTDGHLERGARVLVSIGGWGPESVPDDRRCFGFDCRMGTDRPGFMIVDASELPWAQRDFLGAKLAREQALTDPLLQEVYAILDRVTEAEARFRRFLLG